MTMPSRMSITDFKSLDETGRALVIWQGLTDTWNTLQDTKEKQEDLEVDVKKHDKLLITGNGEPSLLERVRNAEKFIANFEHYSKLVFGAIILQALAFIGGIAVAIVRFLPALERIANQTP